jgi:hypothetical protein
MRLISHYLERAAAVRAMAATMKGSDSRRTLTMLAEQWEALARQVSWVREPQDASAPAQADAEEPTDGSAASTNKGL